MSKARLLVSVLLVSVACHESTPAPQPSPPTVYRLTGLVRAHGTPQPNARLDIVDSANQGRTATTDATGRYSFDHLTPAGFTVRASLAGHESLEREIGLAADSTLDFDLVPLLLVDVTYEGRLDLPPQGTVFAFRGTGIVRGLTCVRQIAGIVQLFDGLNQPIASRAFTGPLGPFRPSDRFTYDGCCFSGAEVDRTNNYHTTFTFTPTPC